MNHFRVLLLLVNILVNEFFVNNLLKKRVRNERASDGVLISLKFTK